MTDLVTIIYTCMSCGSDAHFTRERRLGGPIPFYCEGCKASLPKPRSRMRDSIATLERMWNAGESAARIAAAVGVSRPTVFWWRKKLGLEPRLAPRPRHAPSVLNKVRRLIDQGKTYNEVAFVTGLSRCSVAGIVHRARAIT